MTAMAFTHWRTDKKGAGVQVDSEAVLVCRKGAGWGTQLADGFVSNVKEITVVTIEIEQARTHGSGRLPGREQSGGSPSAARRPSAGQVRDLCPIFTHSRLCLAAGRGRGLLRHRRSQLLTRRVGHPVYRWAC